MNKASSFSQAALHHCHAVMLAAAAAHRDAAWMRKKKDTNASAGGLTPRWVKSRRVSATGAAFVLLKASDRANQRTLRTGGVPCVYMATSCSVLLRKWGRCVCVRARVRVFFSIAARRGLGGRNRGLFQEGKDTFERRATIFVLWEKNKAFSFLNNWGEF